MIAWIRVFCYVGRIRMTPTLLLMEPAPARLRPPAAAAPGPKVFPPWCTGVLQIPRQPMKASP
jgi:hypothetical protein